jgi:hypothetical protein
MDQWTRRIVGFGAHRGVVDGVGLCRMFNRATRCYPLPTYVSSDHDPLYRFHQWQANLRILDVREIKTVPYVPLSHPFVERLIGTIRRECLDRTLFWTTADLEMKLLDFQRYYNGHRTICDMVRSGARRDSESLLLHSFGGISANLFALLYLQGLHLAGIYRVARAARSLVCLVCGHPEISAPYRSESVIYFLCAHCGCVWPSDVSLLSSYHVEPFAPLHPVVERRVLKRRI